MPKMVRCDYCSCTDVLRRDGSFPIGWHEYTSASGNHKVVCYQCMRENRYQYGGKHTTAKKTREQLIANARRQRVEDGYA